MKQLIIGLILSVSYIFGHCQVPCGIYDDAQRILKIEENVKTIEKAMVKIELLFNKTPQSSLDMNQLIRWVNTKEQHAQQIQVTMLEYFLAQRIKPKEVNENGYNKYVELTTLCQKIIFTAMKTKQTLDSNHIQKLNSFINLLVNTYFDDHGLDHLKTLRSN